jgi:hypothetical protein
LTGATADRLSQSAGHWKPFDRGGPRSLIYRNLPRCREAILGLAGSAIGE